MIRKAFLIGSAAVMVCVCAPSAASAQAPCPSPALPSPVYCPPPPPPPPPPLPPAACNALTSQLSLARATIDRIRRTISIFAPITRLASGNAQITLHAAGLRTTFSAPIDSNGRIRVTRTIARAQARLGTGIITIAYPGDADTRPQTVRLRAANSPASLNVEPPTITPAGFLRAEGTLSARARGVVRVQMEFIDGATGETVTLERNAIVIQGGRWSLNAQIPAAILARLLARCSTVHSYTLFTGYLPAGMRGEMRAFEVLPDR